MTNLEKIDNIFRVKYTNFPDSENLSVGLQFESRKHRIWINKYDWFDLRESIILELGLEPEYREQL